jgi:hypothetical protein
VKVYLNKYKNNWLSPYTILEKIYFWREIDYHEPKIERLSNILRPFCETYYRIANKINRKINYVKIDRWDTWSMDHTLAHIIVPMLKQLQKDKHGAPSVDDEDVPDDLKSTAVPEVEEGDTDSNFFLRWDWVLNEMIWAFEQKLLDDDESPFFDHSENNPDSFPWNEKGEYVSKTKVDWEGLKSHQARKDNGFRLFGKYYQALWD